MPKNFNDIDPIEQARLLREQEEAERRGRVGPLGGHQYDSREVEERKDRLRKAGLL